MHLFVSAGEPSGDLHGSNLATAIHDRQPHLPIVGFGGDRMASAGVRLLYPLTDLAVMWFGRAMLRLPTFFRIARRADVYFRSHKPAAVVLIDYPGFHFALAKRAHRAGIPVYYFVPPQLWAWMGWRVSKMQRWVDTVLTALPFEDEWYRSRGVKTHYIGHPYFDELAAQRPDPAFIASQRATGTPIVAILPGSRTQEVTANFAMMVAAAGQVAAAVPGTRFLVPAYKPSHAAMCRQLLAGSGISAEIHVSKTPEIIASADAAIAVSGSVGFELMYRTVPTVVVYKVSPLFEKIARKIATCNYISLVNLIANREVYPEFPLSIWAPEKLSGPVIGWLRDPASRAAVVAELGQLKATAAIPGACARAADYILNDLTARGRLPV